MEEPIEESQKYSEHVDDFDEDCQSDGVYKNYTQFFSLLIKTLLVKKKYFKIFAT